MWPLIASDGPETRHGQIHLLCCSVLLLVKSSENGLSSLHTFLHTPAGLAGGAVNLTRFYLEA